MAVYIFDGGANQQIETFTGATLADREKNYHDDSDFYALVWDEAKERVWAVQYASTRYACDTRNHATVDATPDCLEKVEAWVRKTLAQILLEESVDLSKKITLHKRVVSVSKRSKKFPLGSEGWTSTPYADAYGNWVVDIDLLDGTRVYGVGLLQMQVVEPEAYVHTPAWIAAQVDRIVKRWGVVGAALAICNRGSSLFLAI